MADAPLSAATCEADWPDWEGKDDDPPLTKAGRKEMHQVGEFLARLKAKVDVVLTSPLPRASQTADIAAEHLKVRVHEESMLAPGFRPATLDTIRRKYPQQVLMLVGHEPDFSEVVTAVTGGQVKFAKAGVALVELSDPKRKIALALPAESGQIDFLPSSTRSTSTSRVTARSPSSKCPRCSGRRPAIGWSSCALTP